MAVRRRSWNHKCEERCAEASGHASQFVTDDLYTILAFVCGHYIAEAARTNVQFLSQSGSILELRELFTIPFPPLFIYHRSWQPGMTQLPSKCLLAICRCHPKNLTVSCSTCYILKVVKRMSRLIKSYIRHDIASSGLVASFTSDEYCEPPVFTRPWHHGTCSSLWLRQLERNSVHIVQRSTASATPSISISVSSIFYSRASVLGTILFWSSSCAS